MMITTRAKLIVALILVMCVVGLLIRTAVTKSSTYYMTVTEMNKQGASAIGEKATVSGNIVGNTVQWNPNQPLLQFDIADNASGKPISVVFHGAEPQDFTNGWPIIVTGKLVKPGYFEASTLLIKCPSKYESKPQTFTAQPES